MGQGTQWPLALTTAHALAGPTACHPRTTRPPSTWPCSSPSPDRSVPPAPRLAPTPSQRGLRGTVCVRPPGAALKPLPRTLSSRHRPRGFVRWSSSCADTRQAGPCFWRSHPQSGGLPGSGGDGAALGDPRGRQGARRSLTEPGAELRGRDSVTGGARTSAGGCRRCTQRRPVPFKHGGG